MKSSTQFRPTISLIASAVLAAISSAAVAAQNDYSNQTLDHGISVIGNGNSIIANNLSITGASYESNSTRNEGIYIGAGSSGQFGGEKLEIRFDEDDTSHEFAGIQVNGQETGDASAVFASENTVIDVSGPVSSGKWGFGLLVNGAGTNTASVKFTGGDVFIRTTTENYTAQTATVKANATLDFSNAGNVEIHAYSPFGVTVVDAPGSLTFNNSGNVLLKGEIVPGTHTAQTNVVGMQGGNGNWKVTSAVKELRIELSGAGVDNDGTSYSTGTKGIDMYGSNGTIDIQSESFVIDMDIASDVVDDSPEGHTAEQAYGISIDTNAQLVTGANTVTTITVNEGVGTAYGIYAGYGAAVDLGGNVVIEAKGKTESYALQINGTDIYSEEETQPVQETFVTFAGAQNRLSGDVSVINQGVAGFENGHTTLDGNATIDSSSSLSLKEAALELEKGGTLDVAGTLTSDNGQIVLNDAAENTVSIEKIAADSSLQVVAASSLNDELGGDLTTFQKAISIGNGAEGTSLLMREGLVAGEVTGVLKEDGALDQSTVRTKTNSVMQSTLEMAANMPLVMNRILTNDIRKRLGDLRSSNGQYGAWARYDGGQLSGSSLDVDFHTVQVGFDVMPASNSVRFGAAFSYTTGDADYSRGSSDLDGYSLAAYGTWFNQNGLFVDVVGRVAFFENDVSVDTRHSGSMDNLLLSLSTEAGWRFNLNEITYLEPQVELTYSYIGDDDFGISNARYQIDSTNSFMGRLGFVSGLTCPNNRGDVYLRASVVHEFLGDAKITGRTTGSTGVYETDGADTWIEFGVGANFNLSTNMYIWADVERTEGAAIDEDWRATLGVRYSW